MAQLTVQQAFDLAQRHHQAGRLHDAEILYRQILSQQPDHGQALHYLGLIALQKGQNDAAADLIRGSIALNPDDAKAHSDLGNALALGGKFDEAVAAYRRALSLDPSLSKTSFNLGNALKEQGKLDEAIASYRQAISLRADHAESHINLGNALADKGQLNEAIASHRRALAINPNLSVAHMNLGVALKDKGQLDEAIGSFRRAISLSPNYAQAHFNLGNALKEKEDFDGAIAAYRRALALNLKLPEAHNNLGSALKIRGLLDEAIEEYRRAIALNPGYAEAHNNLGNALKDEGLLDEAVAAYRQAIALKPDYVEAHNNLIYTLHFHPACDSRAIHEEQRRWNDRHARPLAKFIQPHGNTRDPDRPLRIGYVSPDFCEHPVGRFILPLLAAHDRDRFKVFCYSDVRRPDRLTALLRAQAAEWRDIATLSDESAVQLIRQDQIDILVDLTMHMAHNRLLVFARKPAPVQLTYLAYCSTTGLDTMDYRLTDPHLDSPAGSDAFYSEKTVHLPETYWCYARPDLAPEVGPSPAIATGEITFGCLNNFCKVSPDALGAWIQLLRALPKSHLILHAHEGSHRQRIRDLFERQQIEPHRVKFVGRVPLLEYFALHRQIDIGLDPFPYNGGTTTCDALWMGVPVVTLNAQRAVGRGGASVLRNIGLPDLIADTPQQYVEIARALAGDLTRLTELRRTLRSQMTASPLMDAPRFARHVEAAYRQIWRTWCAAEEIS